MAPIYTGLCGTTARPVATPQQQTWQLAWLQTLQGTQGTPLFAGTSLCKIASGGPPGTSTPDWEGSREGPRVTTTPESISVCSRRLIFRIHLPLLCPRRTYAPATHYFAHPSRACAPAQRLLPRFTRITTHDLHALFQYFSLALSSSDDPRTPSCGRLVSRVRLIARCEDQGARAPSARKLAEKIVPVRNDADTEVRPHLHCHSRTLAFPRPSEQLARTASKEDTGMYRTIAHPVATPPLSSQLQCATGHASSQLACLDIHCVDSSNTAPGVGPKR